MRDNVMGLVALLGAVVASMGCGESERDPPDRAGSASSSSGGGGGSGAGGSSGGGAGTSGGGASDPILCGGAYSEACAAGKVCSFDTGCGTVGHCLRSPDGCVDIYDPVCGCDGQTYENECSALAAGVSPDRPGECATLFDCGPHRCGTDSYCIDKGDLADGPWRHACLTLPVTCNGVSSCDCVTDVPSCYVGFVCAPSGGSVTVTCN